MQGLHIIVIISKLFVYLKYTFLYKIFPIFNSAIRIQSTIYMSEHRKIYLSLTHVHRQSKAVEHVERRLNSTVK
jgi:hypothetical protein